MWADLGDEQAPVQLPIHTLRTNQQLTLLRNTYHTSSLSRIEDMLESSQLLLYLKVSERKLFFSDALPMLRSNVKDALTWKRQLVMWNPFCMEDI